MKDVHGIIDGDAGDTAKAAELEGSRVKGSIIKVCKAEADCASGGGSHLLEGGGERAAERVGKNSITHEEQIIKELIKDGVAGTWEGNTPAQGLTAIDHGRHDLFGFHGITERSKGR